MAFCTNCGAQLREGLKFCTSCGKPIETATPVAAVPMQMDSRFSGLTVRYRCPNGDFFDGTEQQATCPTCGAPLAKGGYIQLYRMGNVMGAAVGMGIYINDIPFGHIANKQSIRISLPYGSYKMHVTHTTTRACNDPVFTLSPQTPQIWCKAHFAKAGFKIMVEEASPDDMPTK